MFISYTKTGDSLFIPCEFGYKLYQLFYYAKIKEFVYVYIDIVKTIEEGMTREKEDIFKLTCADFENALTNI